MWTQAEKTLFPTLLSKLKKREEPIKKELKMHQDKIKAIDAELSKAMQRNKIAQNEYESEKEIFDLKQEKIKILYST